MAARGPKRVTSQARSINMFCKQTADLFYKKVEIIWISQAIFDRMG